MPKRRNLIANEVLFALSRRSALAIWIATIADTSLHSLIPYAYRKLNCVRVEGVGAVFWQHRLANLFL